ncbi:Glutaredoxin 3 [Portunus trituberculatus]|uniref:Glutaredoxin 3 n=1 Tax=Portunus trituberculatus TaxID=210409 RepID=A0A5B7HFK1_PORTR|nr:Glutaredoxin 3 [Portunus trituberculatus]
MKSSFVSTHHVVGGLGVLDRLCRSPQKVGAGRKDGLLVAHFMANWAPQCGQMNDVITELAKQSELKDVQFCIVPAEDLSEVSLKYKIAAVPTFLLLRGGQVVEKVEGANAADLTNKVKTQAAKASLVSCAPTALTPEQDLNTRLKKLINSSKCMLFMKGSPDAPRCGKIPSSCICCS